MCKHVPTRAREHEAVSPCAPVSRRSRMSALRGRGTDVQMVAEAVLTLSLRRTPGKFVHEEEGIERAAAMLSRAPSVKAPAPGAAHGGPETQQAQQG